MKIRTKKDRRERIQMRQRKRIMGTAERPRLSVFRSTAHIYAQVIDDMAGKTVASAGSTEATLKKTFSGKVRGGNLAARSSPSGSRKRASRAWCSTAAATCITGGFARSPTRRAKLDWSSKWRVLVSESTRASSS